ncbi:hypothetical protein SAMN04487905_102317 [Actinopolyspora xinjiangensis]|uniref:Uncharacterized protein n=1 Tax=Actinopolyspora xinjiangensis TaxID=405564 RepID=A0A1H0QQ04_9ACTN|nr:hypothetical protein [Actinopolyspora xinjiangensis]SDP18809.1 hypothetical protein SAMN04487905_102317 [Actinopolyspora xinjiangensis]
MTVLGCAGVLAAESHPLTTVVAQDSGPGVQDEGFGKSTPLALFLILVLLIAVVLLARSMSRHLGKVTSRFDEERAAAAAPKRVKRAEAARRRAEADSAGADTSAERAGASEDPPGADEAAEPTGTGDSGAEGAESTPGGEDESREREERPRRE